MFRWETTSNLDFLSQELNLIKLILKSFLPKRSVGGRAIIP